MHVTIFILCAYGKKPDAIASTNAILNFVIWQS